MNTIIIINLLICSSLMVIIAPITWNMVCHGAKAYMSNSIKHFLIFLGEWLIAIGILTLVVLSMSWIDCYDVIVQVLAITYNILSFLVGLIFMIYKNHRQTKPN